MPFNRFYMRNHLISRLSLLLALSLPPLVQAAAPTPFVVQYNASYGSFSAESIRSLSLDESGQRYVMLAETRLTLLGSSLSSIHERSEFMWEGDMPLPQVYSYEQRGLGARSRGIDFDLEEGKLTWTVDGQSGTLPVNEPVYDDLNGFMEIRRQLQLGHEKIEFQVAERNSIKTYRYQVLGHETLDTPVGSYHTVRLERVRDPGSERSTEIWLAPELDYLLLKLRQVEPDGRVIQLDARSVERTAPLGTVATQNQPRRAATSPNDTSKDR
jgi:Protein of unknown function (DUF3108).